MVDKKAPAAPPKRDRYGHTLVEIRREVDAAVESTKGTRGPLSGIYRNVGPRGRVSTGDAASTLGTSVRRGPSGEFTLTRGKGKGRPRP
jgi:hypothetical protein